MINNISFNQDQSCFSASLESGFKIFNTEPLKTHLSAKYGEGIAITSMLFRCNFVALVGGGKRPKFSPNKVVIWDDFKQKFILELEFKSEVKSVQLRKDRIAVALLCSVHVYSFSSKPEKICSFETCDNPAGIMHLTADSENSLLAFPGRSIGHVQIIHLASNSNDQKDVTRVHDHDISDNAISLTTSPTCMIPSHIPEASKPARKDFPSSQNPHYSRKISIETSIIAAHTSPLSCITLNSEATLLATASIKGTLLRVFDTQSGKIVKELRRGSDFAKIFCINFSADSKWLCCSSDKGTVHIFSMGSSENQEIEKDAITHSSTSLNQATPAKILPWSLVPGSQPQLGENRKSTLGFMKDILPKYFSSEWSFATCHVKLNKKFICAFNSEISSIIVIGLDGSYYQFGFDVSNPGECPRQIYHRFLHDDEYLDEYV